MRMLVLVGLAVIMGTIGCTSPQPVRQSDSPQSSPQPWKTPSNWETVQLGMSERQVMSILGKPTSASDSGLGSKTLYYRGEIPGYGFVSGNIQLNLIEDRVWQVNKPVFFKSKRN